MFAVLKTGGKQYRVARNDVVTVEKLAADAGAIRMARDLGPDHTIVTVLCDYGTRYQSKIFNPDFLRSKGLPVPDWIERSRDDIPQVREG